MSGRDFKRAIAAAKAQLERAEMPADAAHRVLRNVTRGRHSPRLVLAGLALVSASSSAACSATTCRIAPLRARIGRLTASASRRGATPRRFRTSRLR
jgi:anti-sigma factor ChrR (cupin superfamily)